MKMCWLKMAEMPCLSVVAPLKGVKASLRKLHSDSVCVHWIAFTFPCASIAQYDSVSQSWLFEDVWTSTLGIEVQMSSNDPRLRNTAI